MSMVPSTTKQVMNDVERLVWKRANAAHHPLLQRRRKKPKFAKLPMLPALDTAAGNSGRMLSRPCRRPPLGGQRRSVW